MRMENTCHDEEPEHWGLISNIRSTRRLGERRDLTNTDHLYHTSIEIEIMAVDRDMAILIENRSIKWTE